MGRRGKWTFLTTGAAMYIVLVVPVLWIGKFFDPVQALGEYFRPTTVEEMIPPQGCVVVNEAPPPDLMRIVRDQENIYHLALQKVFVCISSRRMLGLEQRFAGLPLGEGSPWRTLYGGCCSIHFRRHVIVEVADPREGGSVLVHAALIQSRWDYLRLNWNNVRPWAWRWCLIVALFLVCARLIFLSCRGFVKAVHRVLRGSA
jgi:hypothetical protein